MIKTINLNRSFCLHFLDYLQVAIWIFVKSTLGIEFRVTKKGGI